MATERISSVVQGAQMSNCAWQKYLYTRSALLLASDVLSRSSPPYRPGTYYFLDKYGLFTRRSSPSYKEEIR